MNLPKHMFGLLGFAVLIVSLYFLALGPGNYSALGAGGVAIVSTLIGYLFRPRGKIWNAILGDRLYNALAVEESVVGKLGASLLVSAVLMAFVRLILLSIGIQAEILGDLTFGSAILGAAMVVISGATSLLKQIFRADRKP